MHRALLFSMNPIPPMLAARLNTCSAPWLTASQWSLRFRSSTRFSTPSDDLVPLLQRLDVHRANLRESAPAQIRNQRPTDESPCACHHYETVLHQSPILETNVGRAVLVDPEVRRAARPAFSPAVPARPLQRTGEACALSGRVRRGTDGRQQSRAAPRVGSGSGCPDAPVGCGTGDGSSGSRGSWGGQGRSQMTLVGTLLRVCAAAASMTVTVRRIWLVM